MDRPSRLTTLDSQKTHKDTHTNISYNLCNFFCFKWTSLEKNLEKEKLIIDDVRARHNNGKVGPNQGNDFFHVHVQGEIYRFHKLEE